MRKHIRDQIVELIPTVWEGVKYAKKAQPQQATVVLNDCRAALNAITHSVQAGLSEERFSYYRSILVDLDHLLDALNKLIADGQTDSIASKKMKNLLGLLKKELTDESEVKLEVVFMPYKSSMWDSLESIWLAARDDRRCDVTVVPIPYYDRNLDKSLGTFHYEGGDFPEYVPIVHYDDYDLSARRPDIIYIHNPYDGNNLVTSVDPRFYSINLKKFTEMLVYVPYFISGAYPNIQAFAQKHLSAFVGIVDKIVVQSNFHKQLYMESGVRENKLLPLGSPKIDAFINNIDSVKIPEAWLQKINSRKSIILNSSIGSLLRDSEYLYTLKERISMILSFRELVLIWRPHPLLETTITSMRPALHDQYKDIIRMVENSDNAIIDLSPSNLPATAVSSGMISDTSSWARQYIATEKPVLMLKGKSELKKERMYVFDHFSSYFIDDGFSIRDFCGMVISGKDENKDARMTDLRNSIANSDGSCGEKVHTCIISALE